MIKDLLQSKSVFQPQYFLILQSNAIAENDDDNEVCIVLNFHSIFTVIFTHAIYIMEGILFLDDGTSYGWMVDPGSDDPHSLIDNY